MISKDTIRQTAVTYWSDEDDCFITESPLFDRIAGTGDTEKDALAMFNRMLDESFAELKAGNVAGYNKVGRPSKEGVQLNCRVQEQTHAAIADLARVLDLSQGEVVDVLAFHYLHNDKQKSGIDYTAPNLSVDQIAKIVHEVLDERGYVAATPSKERQKRTTKIGTKGRTRRRG